MKPSQTDIDHLKNKYLRANTDESRWLLYIIEEYESFTDLVQDAKDIEALEADLVNLNDEIEELQRENSNLEDRIDELEAELYELKETGDEK